VQGSGTDVNPPWRTAHKEYEKIMDESSRQQRVDFLWFKENLKFTDFTDNHKNLFSAAYDTWELINCFCHHLTTWYNRKNDNKCGDTIICILTIMTGVVRSFDSAALLFNYGRETEISTHIRRIYEFWFYILFIATDPSKWAFIYNCNSKIQIMMMVLDMKNHPERFGDLDEEKKKIMVGQLENNFQDLRELFIRYNLDFPEKVTDLKKRFGTEWSGIKREKMVEIIDTKFGEKSGYREILITIYAMAYPLWSQSLHGVGYFSSTAAKRMNEKMDFIAKRIYNSDGSLFNAVQGAFMSLGSVIDNFGFDVPNILIERIENHKTTLSSLRVMYKSDNV